MTGSSPSIASRNPRSTGRSRRLFGLRKSPQSFRSSIDAVIAVFCMYSRLQDVPETCFLRQRGLSLSSSPITPSRPTAGLHPTGALFDRTGGADSGAARRSLPVIAERFHLSLGTLRNHVKSIFRKTGTRRQGELVALLCALRL